MHTARVMCKTGRSDAVVMSVTWRQIAMATGAHRRHRRHKAPRSPDAPARRCPRDPCRRRSSSADVFAQFFFHYINRPLTWKSTSFNCSINSNNFKKKNVNSPIYSNYFHAITVDRWLITSWDSKRHIIWIKPIKNKKTNDLLFFFFKQTRISYKRVWLLIVAAYTKRLTVDRRWFLLFNTKRIKRSRQVGDDCATRHGALAFALRYCCRT